MNLGIERFLLLGCFAILILELPELVVDVELGDGFPGAQPSPALVVEASAPESAEGLALDELVAVEATVPEQVFTLPSVPGL